MGVNVGAVLRIADAVGCSRAIFIRDKPYRMKKIRKTARNCTELVNWEVCSFQEFMSMISTLPPLTALELTSRSSNIYRTALPGVCTLVIGSERNGIPPAILEQCRKAVHIPMYGVNGSMNVTHALAVALYEWRRQQEF